MGVLGLAGTLYFGIKSRRLVEKVRKFDWHDIEAGVKYLNKQVSARFQPDVIVTTSAGSASIVASLFVSNTTAFIPFYCGISKRIDADFTSEPPCKRFYTTSRWKTYIPDEVFRHTKARVLILDDVTLSGDSLAHLTQLLIVNGFDKQNVFSASLFATDMSITGNRAPDVYWYRISDTHFTFHGVGALEKVIDWFSLITTVPARRSLFGHSFQARTPFLKSVRCKDPTWSWDGTKPQHLNNRSRRHGTSRALAVRLLVFRGLDISQCDDSFALTRSFDKVFHVHLPLDPFVAPQRPATIGYRVQTRREYLPD